MRSRVGLSSAVLLLAAALVALPSLAYPLGRDQGVYFYVAREWLHHGAIPYRDLFDHKPPGIYVIYAIADAISHGHVWGIRVLELGAIALSGWLAAQLTRKPSGSWPVVVLVASCSYFGFLNFWDTAQCELWCVTLALASAVCAIKPGSRWAFASGAFATAAVLVKLPGVCFIAPVLVLGWRAQSMTRARALSWLGGALALPALAAWYFAANGALGKAIEIVFGANVYYASHEHIDGVSDAITRVLDVFRMFMPLSLVVGYAVAGLPFLRGDLRGERRVILLWTASALLAVVVQLKFYTFHFVMLLAPALVATAVATNAIEQWWSERGSSAVRVRAVVGANVLLLFSLSWAGEHVWFATAKDVTLVELGLRPREQMLARFSLPYADFDESANEQVAAWIRSHSEQNDIVCVRRFEPEVYALSERACSSPFFWTYWLTEPSRAYHRDEFLAEDRTAIEGARPIIIATRRESRRGEVDDAVYAEKLGYVRTKEIGPYILMVDASRARVAIGH